MSRGPAGIDRITYGAFNEGASKPLSHLCFKLLSEQKRTWDDCRRGYESLKGMREREIVCGGFSVRVQHNPGRMKSSLADVREKAVSERPCFLCFHNLPKEQKAIVYRDEYAVLCNPMPVFPSHLTISHVRHRPQSITDSIHIFFSLMADLGDRWTVLYNGPKCGASAPDHLHFQAGSAGLMPIEGEIKKGTDRCAVAEIAGVYVESRKNLGRQVIVFKGREPASVETVVLHFFSSLRKVVVGEEEPMMNVAGFHREEVFTLAVFPRRAHRPAAFFAEGNERIVVSPAVVEMGGVIVTPVEKDFERLDADIVKAIYREVSLEEETVDAALTELRSILPSSLFHPPFRT